MKRIAFALCATLVATAAFAENHYVPNRIKYRDTGHPPATGRSGGASIQALAMIDKNGLAEAEIAADAPGTLQHVQVKTDRHTANYDANGAALTATLPNAGRGSEVSILANVAGTDGRRTGVVAVTDTVVLRPDLSPAGVTTPATALAGMPIQISTVVHERNGDMGARATCALRVDGETVDRATNIWVDASGSVSCVFVHEFAVGDHQLEVALEDVTPRDYDDTNNRATGSIHVTEEQIQPTSWHMYASENDSWSESRAWSVWGHTSYNTGRTWQSNVQLGVTMLETRLNMSTMQLRYSEKTDGVAIVDLDPVPLELTPVARFRQCGRMHLEAASLDILVCQRYKNDERYTRLPIDIASLDVRRDSVNVVYYSHEAAPSVDGYPAYDNEYYGVNQWGDQRHYGNSVTFDIHLTDGTKTLQLERTLPFEIIDYPYTENSRCWGEPEITWCQESKFAGWAKVAQLFQ